MGDALYFVELVRDVEHRHAARIQLGDQLKQTFGLAGGQRCGGLVHDQQFCLAREGLGDFDQLLLSDDQIPHLGVGVDFQSHLLQHHRGLAAHRVIVEQPAALLLVAEKDILRDGQVVGEVEFLMDQHDALGLRGARAAEMHRDAR